MRAIPGGTNSKCQRLAIEEHIGRVEAARTSSAGLNPQLAVVHAIVSG